MGAESCCHRLCPSSPLDWVYLSWEITVFYIFQQALLKDPKKQEGPQRIDSNGSWSCGWYPDSCPSYPKRLWCKESASAGNVLIPELPRLVREMIAALKFQRSLLLNHQGDQCGKTHIELPKILPSLLILCLAVNNDVHSLHLHSLKLRCTQLRLSLLSLLLSLLPVGFPSTPVLGLNLISCYPSRFCSGMRKVLHCTRGRYLW